MGGGTFPPLRGGTDMGGGTFPPLRGGTDMGGGTFPPLRGGTVTAAGYSWPYATARLMKAAICSRVT